MKISYSTCFIVSIIFGIVAALNLYSPAALYIVRELGFAEEAVVTGLTQTVNLSFIFYVILAALTFPLAVVAFIKLNKKYAFMVVIIAYFAMVASVMLQVRYHARAVAEMLAINPAIVVMGGRHAVVPGLLMTACLIACVALGAGIFFGCKRNRNVP